MLLRPAGASFMDDRPHVRTNAVYLHIFWYFLCVCNGHGRRLSGEYCVELMRLNTARSSVNPLSVNCVLVTG